jgi:hypothetical protein
MNNRCFENQINTVAALAIKPPKKIDTASRLQLFRQLFFISSSFALCVCYGVG